VAFLFITQFHFLLDDWRGYLLAGFSIVWIANIYMGLYAMIRIDLKKGKIITQIAENKIEDEDQP
jgi:hypothetical protein